jgi:CubicO group peptidase (beta-lactamase class C family)
MAWVLPSSTLFARRLVLAAALAAWVPAHAQPTAPGGGWDTVRIQALEAQLRATPNVRAFLAERRGVPGVSYYRADTSSTSRLNVASVTKSVTALLAGIAIERGAFTSVDETLAAIFPEHAQGPNAAALSRVTLRHLLTLSTGFDRQGLDSNTDYPDFMQRLHAPGHLGHALGRPLVEAPGSRFYYSNTDAHLVAAALARRLKVPLADFARDELFVPLGISGFHWPPGSDGIPNGAGELQLTAPDLLRVGRMVMDGGRWQGRQVVPERFVREATSRLVASDSAPRGPQELWGYGYLWWTSTTPGDHRPAFYAAGYGGQFIYVVPSLDLVVVAITDQVSREVAGRTAAIIRDFALPAATP